MARFGDRQLLPGERHLHHAGRVRKIGHLPLKGAKIRSSVPAIAAVAIILGAALGIGPARAQELEARTYANIPVGINLLAFGYAYSDGNTFMDPSLPIEGLEAKNQLMFAAYARTFGLLGRAAKVGVLIPAVGGDWEGTIVGTRLQVIAPTGQYDPDELLNLGSNRWTFIPEIGVSHSLTKWTIELTAAAWLFTNNDEFLGSLTLSQRPLWTVTGHAIRHLRATLVHAIASGAGQKFDLLSLAYAFSWGKGMAGPTDKTEK